MTATQSFLNILLAAAISTSLFGFGLRGEARPDAAGTRRRRTRWPSLIGGTLGAFMTGFVALAEMQYGLTQSVHWMALAAAVLAGLIVAGVLLRIGFRGRRVGDHPYCRRCGFDLFGKPEGSTVCNECGSELAAPRAVVTGVHQRRMVPLLAGIFVLIVSLAVTTPMVRNGVGAMQRTNWIAWKSDSALIAQMFAPTPLNAQWTVSSEVWRRLQAGELSEKAMANLVDRYLAAPPVGGISWNANISSAAMVAERAWADGKLDEARMRRVMQACLSLHLVVAPEAAQGRVLRYALITSDLRHVNDRWTPTSKFSFSPIQFTIAGRPVPPSAVSRAATREPETSLALPAAGDILALGSIVDPPLPLGPATVELRTSATITLEAAGRPTLVETRDFHFKDNTTIVEPQKMHCPPVRHILLDEHSILIESAPIVTDPPAPGVHLTRDPTTNRPVIQILPVPEGDFIGDLFLLRADGTEQLLGPVILTHESVYVPRPADLEPPFKLILRPRPERGVELFSPRPIFHVPVAIGVPPQVP